MRKGQSQGLNISLCALFPGSNLSQSLLSNISSQSVDYILVGERAGIKISEAIIFK